MSEELRNCPFCGAVMEEGAIDICIKKDVASEIIIHCRCGGMVRQNVQEGIHATRLLAIEQAKRGAINLWNGEYYHGEKKQEERGA